jgi:hypothetical protein
MPFSQAALFFESLISSITPKTQVPTLMKGSSVTICSPVSLRSYVCLSFFRIYADVDCRQLLYLDFFRFFGTMFIILQKMIKETAVFFLLLVVIAAGFLQSFYAYNFSHVQADVDSTHQLDVVPS